MKSEELNYSTLKKTIEPYDRKGRGESVAFLNWFLENIFRLDPIDADDSICDKPNDKGVDGIFVDHTQEEIIVLQSKLKQKESSIGDGSLREMAGTLTQFETEESIQSLLDGTANAELKRALNRNNVKSLHSKGYKIIGAFVCNQSLDASGQEFLRQCENIRVFDRERISSEFIDLDTEGGVRETFTFDASYVTPMVIKTGNKATTYIYPIPAIELIKLNGIEDGTLFSQNVRQSLGNTKVNKALKDSVQSEEEHENFPLYHNGITILCQTASMSEDKISISDYVVVNGAQSISTFKKTESALTKDLRVIAKIIQLSDASLSKKITINSNNQNAIKARDLKSTNEVQIRLKEEFGRVDSGRFEFEIKRGQDVRDGTTLITNEEAGLLLLSFDLMEPESCHQVYKLFDDKYADIFARPAVTAYRVIFLHQIMDRIKKVSEDIKYKPLANYGLTRFFLLSVVSELMRSDAEAAHFARNPKILFDENRILPFLDAVEAALSSIVIDLNFEVEEIGEAFDYKGDLKSSSKVKELRSKLLRSFEKDVQRKKANSISSMMAAS